MGATRAHFAKPVKCGDRRVAPAGVQGDPPTCVASNRSAM
jgi:hypothetical protein